MLKPSYALSVLFLLAPLGVAGCLGYRTPMLAPNSDEPAQPQQPRNDAGADLAGKDVRPDVLPDTRRGDTGDARDASDASDASDTSDARSLVACQAGSQYVLVLGDDGQLYRFDPTTLALTNLATVSCAGNSLNSMTVSPIGPAYVSTQFGDLCSVDMRTFQVTRTAFNPFNPLTFTDSSYGMALLADSTAAGQTLYIAVNGSSNVNHLERIDLTTFKLTYVGDISPAVPWAELTAGPNGELYGFAVGNPTLGDTQSLLLNIDPKTATAIDVTKVPAAYSLAAFALVYWQDAFYLFLGDSRLNSCTVYRYHKGDAQVATVGALNASIIGAGVALCQ